MMYPFLRFVNPNELHIKPESGPACVTNHPEVAFIVQVFSLFPAPGACLSPLPPLFTLFLVNLVKLLRLRFASSALRLLGLLSFPLPAPHTSRQRHGLQTCPPKTCWGSTTFDLTLYDLTAHGRAGTRPPLALFRGLCFATAAQIKRYSGLASWRGRLWPTFRSA